MPNQVRDRAKQQRSQRMLELSQDSHRRFCNHFLGRTVLVLWEQETKPGSGVYAGLTSNYIRLFARSEKSLSNEITPVKLIGLRNQGIFGEVVNENRG